MEFRRMLFRSEPGDLPVLERLPPSRGHEGPHRSLRAVLRRARRRRWRTPALLRGQLPEPAPPLNAVTADGAGSPPRRRMRGDDRRQHLLDAAAAVLVGPGIAAMSMERLAAPAGVPKDLPYHPLLHRAALLAAQHRRAPRLHGLSGRWHLGASRRA